MPTKIITTGVAILVNEGTEYVQNQFLNDAQNYIDVTYLGSSNVPIRIYKNHIIAVLEVEDIS